MLRTTTLILTASLLALPAFADHHRGGHGQKGGPGGHHGKRPPGGAIFNAPMERLSDKLGLSDKQEADLKQVRASYKAAIEKDWAAVKGIKKQMRELWGSGMVPKKQAVLTLQAKMRTHRVRIAEQMVDAKIRALQILEPGQRRILGKMHGKKKGGPGKGMGRKMGDGKGPGKGKRQR